jgi:hypothetical protein
MTFTVASNSFKDGDYLPSDFILSSDFGFGCAGRNRSCACLVTCESFSNGEQQQTTDNSPN